MCECVGSVERHVRTRGRVDRSAVCVCLLSLLCRCGVLRQGYLLFLRTRANVVCCAVDMLSRTILLLLLPVMCVHCVVVEERDGMSEMNDFACT